MAITVEPDKKVMVIDGTRLKLGTIPINWALSLMSDDGKPTPPRVPVEGAFTPDTTVEDKNDPEYQNALTEWEAKRAAMYWRVLVLQGIVSSPPETAVQHIDFIFGPLLPKDPLQRAAEIKIKWVQQLIKDQTAEFFEKMLGFVVPTNEGMTQAEERFREESTGQASIPPPPEKPTETDDRNIVASISR